MTAPGGGIPVCNKKAIIKVSFFIIRYLLVFRGFEGHEEGEGDFDGVTGDFGGLPSGHR